MAEHPRIEDLRRRVQKDPASIAFAQLAEECRRAGQYQDAVATCRAGLGIHPGYLSARVTLGRALIELDDLDTARGELEHVLKAAPENLAAIRGLAEVHHRQGSLPKALEQYRAALALARNDPDLQRTVDELAQKVEPPPVRASADEVPSTHVQELSSERLQDELANSAASLAPPPVASAPAEAAPALDPVAIEPVDVDAVDRPEDIGGRRQALREIAVLEQWLDAIHVARAQPHA